MQLARRAEIQELVPFAAGASLVCRPFALACFPFRWHRHAEIELTLIQAGRGTRHVGDAIERFVPGDLCLIGPDTPHTWHSIPGPGSSVRSLVIHVPAAPLAAAAAALPELRALPALFAHSRRGLRVVGGLRDEVERAMLALAALDQPLARLAALLGILARLGDGRRCLPLASVGWEAPAPAADGAAARLLRHLHDHRAEPLPQRRVAALAGVSPAGFSRFFKQRFGRTYLSWLTGLRVADACRLLADSDREVLDIALAVGFGNLSNFNRRFRQVQGMTPSAYRRAARGA